MKDKQKFNKQIIKLQTKSIHDTQNIEQHIKNTHKYKIHNTNTTKTTTKKKKTKSKIP